MTTYYATLSSKRFQIECSVEPYALLFSKQEYSKLLML
ncbi:hypothetical protein LEP1GSC005_1716 [Leptospira santarosai str. ST188]|nr:hypothetical protein LEP1GSC005_1716 [Leptospira santarosai str. ST188]